MSAPREADFERLLAHSGWLASLARRLVRDPSLADDLVQDTWCAALRAPRADVVSERGWLAALLQNLARARARSDQARRRRERSVAAGESIEGPDGLVERAEAQRRLLDLVLGLDEPYRSTLLARYVDGHTPAEIARTQRVNESTVRTRLQRAHERLRERLQATQRDGGLLALAPLLSLPGPDVSVAWTGASKSLTGKSLSAAAAAAGIGALIVSTTSKVIVVVALGIAAWLAWNRIAAVEPELVGAATATEADATERGDPGAAPSPAPLEAERRPVEVAAAPPVASAPAAASPPAPTPAGQATLDLVFTRDGAPVRGVAVWIAEADSWRLTECLDLANVPPEKVLRARTDGAGVAAFTQLRGWTYRIGFDVGGRAAQPTRFLEEDVHAGYRHEVRLGSALIRGRAHDERGRPLARAGVSVQTQRPDASWFVLAAITATDEHGDYSVGDLAAGAYDVVLDVDGRFDGLGTTEQRVADLPAGAELVVDFGSASPSAIWSGRVLDALGAPWAGIALSDPEDASSRLQLVSDADGSSISAAIDAEARFRVPVRAGSWQVKVHVPGAPEGGFEVGAIELPAGDLVRDLAIPGARLRGTIVDASGATITGGPDGVRVAVRQKGHDYPSAFRRVQIDAHGSYRIDGLEPGAWIVSVYPGAFAVGETTEITIAPGEAVVVHDLKLAP